MENRKRSALGIAGYHPVQGWESKGTLLVGRNRSAVIRALVHDIENMSDGREKIIVVDCSIGEGCVGNCSEEGKISEIGDSLRIDREKDVVLDMFPDWGGYFWDVFSDLDLLPGLTSENIAEILIPECNDWERMFLETVVPSTFDILRKIPRSGRRNVLFGFIHHREASSLLRAMNKADEGNKDKYGKLQKEIDKNKHRSTEPICSLYHRIMARFCESSDEHASITLDGWLRRPGGGKLIVVRPSYSGGPHDPAFGCMLLFLKMTHLLTLTRSLEDRGVWVIVDEIEWIENLGKENKLLSSMIGHSDQTGLRVVIGMEKLGQIEKFRDIKRWDANIVERIWDVCHTRIIGQTQTVSSMYGSVAIDESLRAARYEAVLHGLPGDEYKKLQKRFTELKHDDFHIRSLGETADSKFKTEKYETRLYSFETVESEPEKSVVTERTMKTYHDDIEMSPPVKNDAHPSFTKPDKGAVIEKSLEETSPKKNSEDEFLSGLDEFDSLVKTRIFSKASPLFRSPQPFIHSQVRLATCEEPSLGKKATWNRLALTKLELRYLMCKELGIDEDELPFCGELMTVVVPEWRIACEKIMRGFALDMIVPEKYFEKVFRYIEAHSFDARIKLRIAPSWYLPNTSAKSQTTDVKRLCDMVDVDQGYRYALWLKDKIRENFSFVCCDTISELMSVENGILKNGMEKRGNVFDRDDRKWIVKEEHCVLGLGRRFGRV